MDNGKYRLDSQQSELMSNKDRFRMVKEQNLNEIMS
jgi:hypothetical protein